LDDTPGLGRLAGETVCETSKPCGAPPRLQALGEVDGVAARSELDVGDHFADEASPAVPPGAGSAYIDPLDLSPYGLADLTGSALEAILPAILDWTPAARPGAAGRPAADL
jgi:hypothetical protein